MFDIPWNRILEEIDAVKIIPEKCNAGGARDFYSEKYKCEIGYLYHCAGDEVKIEIINTTPICCCGLGFDNIDCDCEWEAFGENYELSKTFTLKECKELRGQLTIF